MKWLTTFLALYLLGLSVWPCADETLPIFGQSGYAVLTDAGTSQPGSTHEHHDQCTPFCSCTCCAAIITVIPHFSYSLVYAIEIVGAVVATFQYVSLPWADTHAAIWQPPKRRA